MTRLVLPTTLATGLFAVACFSVPKLSPGSLASGTGLQNVNVTNLYNDTCAKCHGKDGQGGGGGTKTFLTEAKYEQDNDRPFFDAIKKGVPEMGMDAFGNAMSDEVVWSLVVHIRELQGRAIRAQRGSSRPDANGVYKTHLHDYRVETVLDQGLKTPWSIDWLPDGRMLVTNRPGSVLLFKKGESAVSIDGLPKSIELGQGGMMEVAVHPDYAKNGWVYLSIADPKKDGGGALTKIVRGKLKFEGSKVTWGDEQTIFEAEQQFYSGAGIHFGGKIAFDKQRHIFFSVGERGGNMLAQQIDNPYGKMYRLNDDGTAPADNPYVKDASGKPAHVKGIWTLGHRNPQGLSFDLEGGLWDTEHGPRGGDEVNQIKAGANYGWPLIAFSINYNDTPFHTPWPSADQNFSLPAFRWLPSTGASGLDVARGPAFPKWKGDLIAGGLVGQNLDRLRMKDGKLVEHEELLHGMGRIRDVSVGPDGDIYLALNEPDKVVRLVPAN